MTETQELIAAATKRATDIRCLNKGIGSATAEMNAALFDRLASALEHLVAERDALLQKTQQFEIAAAATRAPDPELSWDGKGKIFDPRCHCENCAIGRAEQRARNAGSGEQP